jgi:hypothetical protein
LEKHTCPRRHEDGTATEDSPLVGSGENLDAYSSGHGIIGQGRGCTYCGSMHPDDFMDAMREGATLGVTDKNYKAYVKGYKNNGDNGGKFYFQHLSREQKIEFVGLLNDKKINFGYPGRFTVLPYFIGQ